MGTLLDLVEVTDKEKKQCWVSETNASIKAFEAANELFLLKFQSLENSRSMSNMRKKSNWQISISEVATHISVSRVTLGNTASYAEDLKGYIAELNQSLLEKKLAIEKSIKETRRKGRKAHRKSELMKSNQQLRREIDELEKRQTVELLQLTMEKLSLPVRQALGFV
tara:strand:+ start:60 stop:560 length:501 start_codon:yes stop_codon:yes gene_type:complete